MHSICFGLLTSKTAGEKWRHENTGQYLVLPHAQSLVYYVQYRSLAMIAHKGKKSDISAPKPLELFVKCNPETSVASTLRLWPSGAGSKPPALPIHCGYSVPGTETATSVSMPRVARILTPSEICQSCNTRALAVSVTVVPKLVTLWPKSPNISIESPESP
jgi:hypothetical protein